MAQPNDWLPESGWPAWRGLLLEEDKALKNKLTGLTVTDVNDISPARQVGVWYRMPEQELRTKTFPFIVIDFMSEEVEHDREHRGVVTYYHEANTGNALAGNDAIYGVPETFPIPLRLTYQVMTYARNSAHDRQMLGLLNHETRLHPRFAYLETLSGTIRRLDVVSGPQDASMLADDGKRLFRKTWTVAVSSEIVPALSTGTRVATVVATLKTGSDPSTAQPLS